MSFPQYQSTKESGVEWLGRIPAHWEKLTLGRVTLSKCDGPFGSGLKSEHYTDVGVRVIRLQNIKSAGFEGADAAFVDADYYGQELGDHDVVGGDLLVAGLGDDRNLVGRACVAPDDIAPAMVKADCFRFRLDATRADPAFISAQLSAGAAYDAGTLSTGSTRSRIPLSIMASRAVALPPMQEQKAIVTFLNRETAKIDDLVAEQQRLIELLTEKRQAVISHAVTKGFDPATPMKHSGVEWLGDVPAHWDVAPIGSRYAVQLGRMLNEERANGDNMRPYLRVFDVQWRSINTTDLPLMDFPPEAKSRYRLQPGDLIVNEGGSYVGRSAIWRGDIDECYYQKALHRLRPHDAQRDASPFLLHVMEMATRMGVFVAGGNQTTINHLTAEQLRRYRFAFPPTAEQTLIAEQLDLELGRFEDLVGHADAAIALLQERRAALISAAVTGKIDVRGLVSAEAEAA